MAAAQQDKKFREYAGVLTADLANAMNAFDNKMANVMEEAKKGRSKLAMAAAQQDKKFREYANNEVKKATAQAAAEFAKVRATMAKDRAAAKKEAADRVSKFETSFKLGIMNLKSTAEH